MLSSRIDRMQAKLKFLQCWLGKNPLTIHHYLSEKDRKKICKINPLKMITEYKKLSIDFIKQKYVSTE